MSGKNKGGREIRKPKQAKKSKTDDTLTVVPKVNRAKKAN